MNEIELVFAAIKDKCDSSIQMRLKPDLGQLAWSVQHQWCTLPFSSISITHCGDLRLDSGMLVSSRGCFSISLADPESINKTIGWINYCISQGTRGCVLCKLDNIDEGKNDK